jgi:toxin ParE1/3/4
MRDQPGNLISLRAQISGDDPAAAKRVALHILHCIEELLPPNLQLGPPGRVPGTRELVIPKTPFIVPTECTRDAANLARVSTPNLAGAAQPWRRSDMKKASAPELRL